MFCAVFSGCDVIFALGCGRLSRYCPAFWQILVVELVWHNLWLPAGRFGKDCGNPFALPELAQKCLPIVLVTCLPFCSGTWRNPGDHHNLIARCMCGKDPGGLFAQRLWHIFCKRKMCSLKLGRGCEGENCCFSSVVVAFSPPPCVGWSWRKSTLPAAETVFCRPPAEPSRSAGESKHARGQKCRTLLGAKFWWGSVAASSISPETAS